jgi:hypothetical protein
MNKQTRSIDAMIVTSKKKKYSEKSLSQCHFAQNKYHNGLVEYRGLPLWRAAGK